MNDTTLRRPMVLAHILTKDGDKIERTQLLVLFLSAGLMFFLPGLLWGWWNASKAYENKAPIQITTGCVTKPKPVAKPNLL